MITITCNSVNVDGWTDFNNRQRIYILLMLKVTNSAKKEKSEAAKYKRSHLLLVMIPYCLSVRAFYVGLRSPASVFLSKSLCHVVDSITTPAVSAVPLNTSWPIKRRSTPTSPQPIPAGSTDCVLFGFFGLTF